MPIFLAATHTLHMHNSGCLCVCVCVCALHPNCWCSNSRWLWDIHSDICAEKEVDLLRIVGLCVCLCGWICPCGVCAWVLPSKSTCLESLSPHLFFWGFFFLLLAKSRLNKYKCANTWPFAWLEYFITSTWNCHHFQTISNNLQYTSYHCPAEDPDLEEARSGSRKALSSCSHSRAIMLVLLYYAHLLLWWQHLKILHFMTKCTKIA